MLILFQHKSKDAFHQNPIPNALVKKFMNIESERGTRALPKYLTSWGITLGLLSAYAMPAMANHLNIANVKPNCNSYSISVSASALNLN
jgi:hypothetical protein